MKKKIFFCLISAFLLLFHAKTASAVGLGMYVDMGFSNTVLKAEYRYIIPVYNYDRRFVSNNFLYGGGLMLDTCVADDRLFNYRLKLTFESYQYPYLPIHVYYLPWGLYTPTVKQSYNSTLKLGMKHIFGFRIFGNNTVRVWGGPTISAAFYPLIQYSYVVAANFLVPGISCGVNYKIHELLSLTAECGFTYNWVTEISSRQDIRPIFFDVSFGVMFRVDESQTNRTIQLQEM